MKLENLVPDLYSCQQIPEGAFADSALVWKCGMFLASDPPKPVWEVMPRDRSFGHEATPAPTLQEILEDLARWEFCPHIGMLLTANGNVCGTVGADMRRLNFEGGNLMDTALKLWLELKGVE